MQIRRWHVGLFLLALITSSLSGCDDDDDLDFFERTDVIGRMVLPDGTAAGGASCEIFVDNFSFGIDIAAPDGVFEFDDWPEEYEPFLVRGTYVQPGTGTIFRGASLLFGTNNSGNTNIGDILLTPTDSAVRWSEELEGASIAWSDADLDGHLEPIPAPKTPR